MSMYNSSIPVLQRYLSNYANILKKAEAHVEEKKLDESALCSFRLFPDMLPFRLQVIIACDMAKGCGARLSGVEAPKFEDTETTFAELQERIAKTQAFLATLSVEQIDGTEEKAISLKAGPTELNFSGAVYLNQFVLPNFYFHIATGYNILRHNGVVLGKMDFMGA